MNYKRMFREILGLNTPFGNEVEKVIRGKIRHNHYLSMLSNERAKRINTFYFVVDPSIPHPGLADRLKAIVSCYNISRKNGYDFKLVFEEPYSLSDYLTDNVVKWKASPKELEYSRKDTLFFIYTKSFIGSSKVLVPNKQYHCYTYSGRLMFNEENERLQFYTYFRMLFKSSPLLQKAIDDTGLIKGGYLSVHVRFVNAIGGFEYGSYPILPKEDQVRLINRCKDAIVNLTKEKNMPIVVFSDSVRFLDEIKDLPVTILDTKNIKHLNEARNEDSVLKTFLDFMIISRSKRVFRLVAKELYKTEFSVYAAYAGGIEIENIEV